MTLCDHQISAHVSRGAGGCAEETFSFTGRISEERGGARGRRSRGFSLIEIMVAVTLLSLIMIGLLAVFNHVQRALHIAHMQTDVFEGARAVVDLVTRDFAGVTAADQGGTWNVYASDISVQTLPVPGMPNGQTNVVQDLFMLSRDNSDNWSSFGYYINQRAAGVGTLFRFARETTNGWWLDTASAYTFTNWWQAFMYDASLPRETNRVVDGVVHFQARAFDEKGRMYTPNWTANIGTSTNLDTNYVAELQREIWIGKGVSGNPSGFGFAGRFLPAYIEIEIGLLEPQITRQFNAIAADNPTAAQTFLQNQAGKIHLFRQRIPVRNHLKPEAFN